MYREIKPSEKLSPFIECFWTSKSTGLSPRAYRVLPDGCADLIFDFTPGQESSFWVGTMTKSLVVEGAYSRDLLGIRFHPGAARLFLSATMHTLLDLRVSGTDLAVWTHKALDLLSGNTETRIAHLEKILMEHLIIDPRFYLVRATFQLTKNKSGIRVNEVADTLGVSRQYLNRVMKEFVGVDLKLFQRIWRMRSLTSALSKTHEYDWASHAVTHGYYDQSHLINDFNELVGLTPTQYLKS